MEKIQPILNDAILSFLADCAQNPILKTSILASIWTQKEKERDKKEDGTVWSLSKDLCFEWDCC